MRPSRLLILILIGGYLLVRASGVLAYPSSTNYQLKAFSFGNGGTSNSTSTNYALNAIAGEAGLYPQLSSSNYKIGPGLNATQQANVPGAPTFTNPANYYDKLLLVIDTQSNPSDTKFAVAISTDNFVTTQFVKSDNTVTNSLTFPTDYRTFSGWGSGSGTTIIGLTPNTTYYVKVKAYSGQFTESAFGPVSTAATVGQQLSFCVYTNANCGAGGNTEAFGSIPVNTVTSSPTNVGIDFATNGDSGGRVYLSGSQAGLNSAAAGYTITSASTDLGTAAEGFGAQVATATQTSGGPFSAVSPYSVSTTNVGIVNSTIRELLNTTNPIVGGTAAVTLKARTQSITPAATDYSDVLTVVAAGIF